MKKLVVVLLTLSWVACGKEDPPPANNKCTPAEIGATRCTGNVLEECNGTLWNSKQNCATTNLICQPTAGYVGVASCVAQTTTVGAFGVCGGATQVCDTDLTCVDPEDAFFVVGADSFCAEYCDTSADCGTQICETAMGNLNFLASQTDDSVTAWPTGQNGWCADQTLPRGDACGWDGHSCQATFACETTNLWDLETTCKLKCDGGAVGTGQSTCPVDEECLASPFVELQGTAPTYVECTTDANCNEAGFYYCAEIGAPTKLCVRPEGRCGVPVRIVDNYSDAGIEAFITDDVNPDAIDVTAMCNPAGFDQYCAASTATSNPGPVECEPHYYGTTAACVDDGDCEWQFGERCTTFSSGKRCASTLASCVAYCSDIDGNSYNCPAGYSCVLPTNTLPFPFPWFERLTNGTARTCTGLTDTSSCNQGTYTGFTCMDFSEYSIGFRCAKTPMVCQAN